MAHEPNEQGSPAAGENFGGFRLKKTPDAISQCRFTILFNRFILYVNAVNRLVTNY